MPGADDPDNEDEPDHTAAVRRCLRLYIALAAATADTSRLEAVTGCAPWRVCGQMLSTEEGGVL